MATATTARTLTVQREAMRFAQPFRISGYTFEAMPSIVATIGAILVLVVYHKVIRSRARV